MSSVTIFPTTFAIAIMRGAGLYYSGDIYKLQRTDDAYGTAMDQHERLQEFQKFSVLADLDHSLVAYHSIELSKDQLTLLELVHKHTTAFVRGHVIENLLDKLSSDSKLSVDVAQLVLNELGVDNDKGGAGIRKLIVELTKPND